MIESKHNSLLGPVAQILDPYARQARLYPALIVILPIALLIVVWFPALWTTWGALISLASSFGLIVFISQVARDRGKRREPELYQAWGGKPSVALLRHRDTRIDNHTKARYLAFLKTKLPQLSFPTAEEERANPEAADGVYQSVTTWLLTQTRDTKQFSILFRENISFGFRRNMWGLKSVGTTAALLAACVSTAVIIYQYWVNHLTPSPEIAVITVLVWFLFIVWITIITPPWVRLPADAYGMQLLAACDTLNTPVATRGKPRELSVLYYDSGRLAVCLRTALRLSCSVCGQRNAGRQPAAEVTVQQGV
jgi:hypothetical protein